MFGLYIHIPFCRAKCRYCDFNSRPAAAGEIERYLRALRRELGNTPDAGRRADTVYLGGGTPTLLAADQLESLLASLHAAYRIAPGAEISIEANPGTIDAAKAAHLFALGITRVSIGMQSLDDALLRRLGRRHTAAEAIAAFGILRAAGFTNLGVDMMHALPGQTPAGWEEELSRVIALGPEHLSLYALSIETGTPLAAERAGGALALPTEAEELAMLRIAQARTAAAGYEHYEISNFCRPGHRCRHNMSVWKIGEYRGFGAGAHSFLRTPAPVRFANEPDPERYVRRIEDGTSPELTREALTHAQFAGEALMLGLRMQEGLAIEDFARDFGAPPGELFAAAVAFGTAQGWLEEAGAHLRLTGRGVLFSNEIFRRIF